MFVRNIASANKRAAIEAILGGALVELPDSSPCSANQALANVIIVKVHLQSVLLTPPCRDQLPALSAGSFSPSIELSPQAAQGAQSVTLRSYLIASDPTISVSIQDAVSFKLDD